MTTPEPGSFFFGGATDAVDPPPTDMAPNFDYDMMFGQGYRDWRHQFSARFGEQPNYNDPLFDYHAAWMGGSRPEPYAPDTVGGEPQYHWQSSVQNPPRITETHLKQPGHPTYWMEPFVGQYGGIDPNDQTPEAHAALANALSNPNVGPLIPGNPQLDPHSSDALMQQVMQSMLQRLGGVEP